MVSTSALSLMPCSASAEQTITLSKPAITRYSMAFEMPDLFSHLPQLDNTAQPPFLHPRPAAKNPSAAKHGAAEAAAAIVRISNHWLSVCKLNDK
jgi:hypothetical protein